MIASGTVESLKNGSDLESSFLALTEHEAPPAPRRA
jgi:hypothetical protein